MNNSEQANNIPLELGLSFWLQWVVASALGLVVGRAIGLRLVCYFVCEPVVDTFNVIQELKLAVVFAFSGVTQGAVVGLAQWLVLRRVLRWSVWWIPTTAIGLATGGIIFGALGATFVAGPLSNSISEFSWVFLVILTVVADGIMVGAAQSFALDWDLIEPSSWILISLVGWTSRLLVMTYVDPTLGGVVLGMITGAALVLLVSRPIESFDQDFD